MSADGYDVYLQNLIIKAANLGISFARSAAANSLSDNHNTSGAESNATLDTSHARSVSTGSQGSASTTLTSHSSNNGHNITGKILVRRRPRGLSFAQYERYLSHINPNLGQPKFLASPPSEAEAAPSLFGMGTKKSYRSIRKSLSKIRGRSTTSPCPEPLILWVNNDAQRCGGHEGKRRLTHAFIDPAAHAGKTYNRANLCESCPAAIVTAQPVYVS
jgi:hypothetical protein